MTAPTLTYGDGHLEDFIDPWNWDYERSATSDGNVGGTTTIDTVRTEADDTFNGAFIKFLSGLNAGEHRKITDWDQASHTFTHLAFDNQTLEGDRYVLSKCGELTVSNMVDGDMTWTLNPEDVLEMEGAFDDASTEEYSSLYFPLTTTLDSDVYTKCLVRHKSGNTNQGCRVVLVFSSGTQSVVLNDNTTTWKVTSASITAAKTIIGFRVYVQNPATDATPTDYTAYYDFVKICKGTFTFPHLSSDGKAGGLFPTFKSGDVLQKVPGRGGEITNSLGMCLPEFVLRGDMLQGESWGTPFGQYFLDILRNDTWSWFTSDRICCKVRIVEFKPDQDVASGAVASFTLTLRMFMYSDINDTVWDGVDGWLGIES